MTTQHSVESVGTCRFRWSLAHGLRDMARGPLLQRERCCSRIPPSHAAAIRSFISRELGPKYVRGIHVEDLGVPDDEIALLDIVQHLDGGWLSVAPDDIQPALEWLYQASGVALRPLLESILERLPKSPTLTVLDGGQS